MYLPTSFRGASLCLRIHQRKRSRDLDFQGYKIPQSGKNPTNTSGTAKTVAVVVVRHWPVKNADAEPKVAPSATQNAGFFSDETTDANWSTSIK